MLYFSLIAKVSFSYCKSLCQTHDNFPSSSHRKPPKKKKKNKKKRCCLKTPRWPLGNKLLVACWSCATSQIFFILHLSTHAFIWSFKVGAQKSSSSCSISILARFKLKKYIDEHVCLYMTNQMKRLGPTPFAPNKQT